MLRWRLILEEYGPGIEYIMGDKHIAAYALSRLPKNVNQETTHESTYTAETMSKSMTLNNCHRAGFLYILNSYTAIRGKTPYKRKNLIMQNILRVLIAEARIH